MKLVEGEIVAIHGASKLLRQAFARAAEAWPEHEQDEFARWLLDAIENDEGCWEAALGDTTKLQKLADQAIADIRTGRSKPLDSDKL